VVKKIRETVIIFGFRNMIWSTSRL